MRAFLNSALKGIAFGIALCLGIAASGAAIPIFVGPGQSGGTVANQPQNIADLNSLVNAINSAIGTWLTFNNSSAERGEVAFTQGSTFAANGTVSVAAVGSTGVFGSQGVVHEWLIVVDEAGAIGYIPVYE